MTLASAAADYDSWAWTAWESSVLDEAWGALVGSVRSNSLPAQGPDPRSGSHQRGLLRGRAEAEGWTGFPETDVVRWAAPDGVVVDHRDAPALIAMFHDEAEQWSRIASAHPRREAIIRHHAGCLTGWGGSVAGSANLPAPRELEDPLAWLASGTEFWVDALRQVPLDHVYVWRRPSQGDRSFPLWYLALHTANHGAYHRGHLAGLDSVN